MLLALVLPPLMLQRSFRESNNAAYSLSSFEAPSSSSNVAALAQNAMQSGSFDWAQLYSAYESGAISKAEIQSFIDQARQTYGVIDDSLIQQQAIEAVKAEYEALGMDLGVIQLQYLAWLGAQMLECCRPDDGCFYFSRFCGIAHRSKNCT